MNFTESSSEAEYTLTHALGCDIRLIPEHSLWAHVLFNASIALAEFIQRCDVMGKTVLELGAGAALPSIMAAKYGAHVLATDFPEQEIINNILYNAEANDVLLNAEGLIFGADPGR